MNKKLGIQKQPSLSYSSQTRCTGHCRVLETTNIKALAKRKSEALQWLLRRTSSAWTNRLWSTACLGLRFSLQSKIDPQVCAIIWHILIKFNALEHCKDSFCHLILVHIILQC